MGNRCSWWWNLQCEGSEVGTCRYICKWEQPPAGAGRTGRESPSHPSVPCPVPYIGAKSISHGRIKAPGGQGPTSKRSHYTVPLPWPPPQVAGNRPWDSVGGAESILIPESASISSSHLPRPSLPQGITQNPNFKLLNCLKHSRNFWKIPELHAFLSSAKHGPLGRGEELGWLPPPPSGPR